MSLQFNVSQLLKAGIGSSRSYELSEDGPLLLDDTEASNIHGNVKFILTNFGIMATVDADASLHLNCARCLEDFVTNASVDFTEEYRPSIDIATGLPPDSAPHSDMVFEIPSDHTIDLTEALRQHLLLAVDLIPICSDDCRGLCPICGSNLNTTSCNCSADEEANPFAVLQGLFAEHDSE